MRATLCLVALVVVCLLAPPAMFAETPNTLTDTDPRNFVPLPPDDGNGILGVVSQRVDVLVHVSRLPDGRLYAGASILSWVLPGTVVEYRVYRPDGRNHTGSTIPTPRTITLVEGTDCLGSDIFLDYIPEDWTVGFATFEAIVIGYGRRWRAITRYPIGMSENTPTGSLIEDLRVQGGGVLAVGDLKTPMVATAPAVAVAPLLVEGWNYIPPQLKLGHGGPTIVTGCSSIESSITNRECLTRVVDLPLSSN